MTFEEWWYASKYMQVVISSKSDEQIARDAWNAGYEAGKSAPSQEPMTADWLDRKLANADDGFAAAGRPCDGPNGCNANNCIGCGETAPSQEPFNDLRPCPFCGDQPIFEDVGDYYVQCPSCGAQGSLGLSDGLSHAAEAWNKRITPPDAAAQIAKLNDDMEFMRQCVEEACKDRKYFEEQASEKHRWQVKAESAAAQIAQYTCPAHVDEVKKGGACAWCQIATLEAELATSKREAECYRIQVEKDYNESDIDTIMWQGVEIAKLKARIEGLEAPLQEQLCIECGGPTMHSGNKCYSCCQKSAPSQEPVAYVAWSDPSGIRWALPDSPGMPDGLPLYTAAMHKGRE